MTSLELVVDSSSGRLAEYSYFITRLRTHVRAIVLQTSSSTPRSCPDLNSKKIRSYINYKDYEETEWMRIFINIISLVFDVDQSFSRRRGLWLDTACRLDEYVPVCFASGLLFCASLVDVALRLVVVTSFLGTYFITRLRTDVRAGFLNF